MINFAVPSITQKEINSVLKVMESGWLTTGEQNRIFAEKINNYAGSKFCIPMNSCTAALHIALRLEMYL